MHKAHQNYAVDFIIGIYTNSSHSCDRVNGGSHLIDWNTLRMSLLHCCFRAGGVSLSAEKSTIPTAVGGWLSQEHSRLRLGGMATDILQEKLRCLWLWDTSGAGHHIWRRAGLIPGRVRVRQVSFSRLHQSSPLASNCNPSSTPYNLIQVLFPFILTSR